jgi:hypothetical protein
MWLRLLPYIMIAVAVLGAWAWWHHHWAVFEELQASVATMEQANAAQKQAIDALQLAQQRTDEAMQHYQVASQDAARIAQQARQSVAKVMQSKPVADYGAIPIPDDLRVRLCGQFRCEQAAGVDDQAAVGAPPAPAAAAVPTDADAGLGGLFARLRWRFAPGVPATGQPAPVH